MERQLLNVIKKNKFFLCIFLLFILYAIYFWGEYIYQEKICVLNNENTNAYLWWDSFHSIENVDINTNIKQEFIAKENYQSISLRFINYEKKLNGKGKITVSDGNNNFYLNETFDLSEIVNGEFKEFVFEKNCIGNEKNPIELIIQVSAVELEGDNSFSVMVSNEDTYENVNLYINNEKQEGDLILNLAAVKSTNWKNTIYICLCILLGSFICLMYYFKEKLSIEKIAVISIIFLGILSNIINPHKSISDEDAHFHTIYRLSNAIMGKEYTLDNQETMSNFEIREGDKRHSLTEAPNIDTYESILQNFKLIYNDYDQQESTTVGRNVTYGIFPYLLSALAISICRVFRIGLYPMLFMSRFINLMYYVCCMYLAIKKIPYGKNVIFLLSILPLNIQQAASFSADGFLTATCTFIFAHILYLIYEKEKIRLTDILLIYVIGYSLVQCKVIYALFISLIIFIPKTKFPKLSHKIIFLTGAVLIVMIGFLRSGIGGNVMQSSAESDNNYYGIIYILEHPIHSIKMIFNSIFQNADKYLNSILGGELQWSSISISFIWKVILIINIVLSIMIENVKYNVSNRLVTYGIGLGILFIVGIHVIGLALMTTKDWQIVQGIGGRYFMPILPLFTTFFAKKDNNNLIIIDINKINIMSMMIECLTLIYVYSIIISR